MQAPTLSGLLAWHPQPVPLFELGCFAAALIYLLGVAHLTGRGITWPTGRTISFLTGLLMIVAVTGTGIGGYGMVLFSAHMGQHMVLNMLAPVFVLLGAPVTLALRALSSTGRARRILLTGLHSRFVQVTSNPAVTVTVFLVSLYGMYFTPVLDWAMSSWAGHTVMLLHFILVGLLFFWPIVGIDPGPRRHSYPVRIAELVFTMPFHAFFGIAIMMSSELLGTSFATLPSSWGIDPLIDQNTGGAIAWAFSEVPTVIVLLAVMWQWARSDERAARAYDRQADRDGDAALARYNEQLQMLAATRR